MTDENQCLDCERKNDLLVVILLDGTDGFLCPNHRPTLVIDQLSECCKEHQVYDCDFHYEPLLVAPMTDQPEQCSMTTYVPGVITSVDDDIQVTGYPRNAVVRCCLIAEHDVLHFAVLPLASAPGSFSWRWRVFDV